MPCSRVSIHSITRNEGSTIVTTARPLKGFKPLQHVFFEDPAGGEHDTGLYVEIVNSGAGLLKLKQRDGVAVQTALFGLACKLFSR